MKNSNNKMNFSQQDFRYSKTLNNVLNNLSNGNNKNQELEQLKIKMMKNEIELNISIKNIDDNINIESAKINILKKPQNLSSFIFQIIPLYCYYLQINEEQYEKIKNEQRLLMDFKKFQDYIIELLNNCKNSNKNKFSCIIEKKENENYFIIEEKTEYKKVNHIVLKIEKGYNKISNLNENKVNYNILIQENNILKKENQKLNEKVAKLENIFKNNSINANQNGFINIAENKEEKYLYNIEKNINEDENKSQINQNYDNNKKKIENIDKNKFCFSYDQLNLYKSEIITLYEENTALKKKNIDLNKINKNLIIQLNKKKKEIDLLNKQLQNINDKLNKLENINNKLNNKLNDNDLHIENLF